MSGPRILRLEEEDPDEVVAEVAGALRGDRLVVIPTETVYGLAGAVRSGVADRIFSLKERPRDVPLARLVASRARAGEIVRIPVRARRLVERYWPGPLTLVCPAVEGDEEIGVRVPGNPFALRLLEELDGPLLATSANRHGEPPARTGAEAAEALGEEVALVVDAGETALGEASTVVRVTPDAWQVLREGVVTSEMVEARLFETVLFVCTGNSCRSPMAEGLLKAELADRLDCRVDELERHGWRVGSAGVSALGGSRASEHAVTVLEERGIDISDHRSRPVSAELVERATRIYCMSPGHRSALREWYPEVMDDVTLLDPEGIPDPVGADEATYRETAGRIAAHIPEILDRDFPGWWD